MRLEANKPTQLPIDSIFHFGASTRMYTLREKPKAATRPIIEELEQSAEDSEGGLLGLPETETELDVIDSLKYLRQKMHCYFLRI
jgi:nuclear inhibitor of protein phosphatase 1